MRAEFTLEGLDWRSWSAADFAAVTFLMLRRMYAGDQQALMELHELVGDKDTVAALSRQLMGQPRMIETDR